MLRFILQWAREDLYSRVVRAGYDDLNPAHVMILRYPGAEGRRPSEIANEARITKQSVNDLVRHLEGRGYVILETDPSDGRARVLHLTEKGRALERVITAEALETEKRITEPLGPIRYARLREALEVIIQDLGGSAERS
jgi:DNA-binding MarR family transcriptional regulator